MTYKHFIGADLTDQFGDEFVQMVVLSTTLLLLMLAVVPL